MITQELRTAAQRKANELVDKIMLLYGSIEYFTTASPNPGIAADYRRSQMALKLQLAELLQIPAHYPVVLELPEGDRRTLKTWFTTLKEGKQHVCVQIVDPEQKYKEPCMPVDYKHAQFANFKSKYGAM